MQAAAAVAAADHMTLPRNAVEKHTGLDNPDLAAADAAAAVPAAAAGTADDRMLFDCLCHSRCSPAVEVWYTGCSYWLAALM